ncbi:MAG: carbamoyltransferase HypF [Planctomycetes bacterium]|nr:carbamoyltransferase HypF [Planctomycetota bacterium]
MRPAIARLAQQRSLVGYVSNTHDGVEVHVEGSTRDVERFEQELPQTFPAAANVTTLRKVIVDHEGFDTFVVAKNSDLPSSREEQVGVETNSTLSVHVPPDVAVCNECLTEVQDRVDLRCGYPFTSCTNCGPRFSIIERMPYERAQTTMASFPLCVYCRGEYGSVDNRRFHSQINACPDCGPQIWLRDTDNRISARGDNALRAATAAILDGQIVALRGVGGYQLLVDATSDEAVERLRLRKRRRGKPLAVMVKAIGEATKLARLGEIERNLLCEPSNPIVVVETRCGARLAASVTSGLNTIGIMLPSTPLHWLLLDAIKRPLVCTSGNVEGDPLVYEPDAALTQLSQIADVWFEHDRPIAQPIDDSVVRVMAGRRVSIRLARGYVPLPLDITTDEPLIALGGHQKTSLALSNGVQSVLGPHLGDLDSLNSRQRFVEQVSGLSELYGIDDCKFVGDMHPEYFTSQWQGDQLNSVAPVQHHHAHIAAGVCEQGWQDRQVLGVSFDGTGYGTDGTIWGGEFLLATTTGFERVGCLRPFALAGGERAVRQPWRVAVALVRDALGNEEASRLRFDSGDAKSLVPFLNRPHLSPVTTSAGRLFDGVAALILGIEESQFEGQAAMFLEAACDERIGDSSPMLKRQNGSDGYSIPIHETQPKQLDWRRLVRQVLRDRAAGVSSCVMAMRFHRGLANAIFDFCGNYSPLPVVLGGGVFQNRVLLELLAERFAGTAQLLGLPGLIPPNDGGLAAGQLAVAAARARQGRTSSCV